MSDVSIVEESSCPFPGLRPFREAESHLFFGREIQAEEILRCLERNRFLALLGTSGSGKSSLINAGLIPALRGDYLVGARSKWQIVTMRPGGDPLGRLADTLARVPKLEAGGRTALRDSSLAIVKALEARIQSGGWDSDTNLLIVVDQFEEMFRYAAASPGGHWDERSTFVKLLIEASRAPCVPLYVVLCMRSEYLGDCAQFRDLPETINQGQYLIPRLTREHWRAAIEQPARLMGATFAPALVQQLLNDVTRLEGTAGGVAARTGDDADSLPLLQHALKRTWFCFEKRMASAPSPVREVSLQCYQEAGGIDQALSNHLDEAYGDAKRLGDAFDLAARRVFQRLRARDAKAREVRDPLPFDELCAVVDAPPEQVARVIDCFRQGDRSFLTPEAPAELRGADIDLTHECLLRRWTTLREWIREEDESRRIYLRVARAMDDKDCLRGVSLQEASEWWKARRPNAAWARRYDPRFDDIARFLDDSVADEERRRREAAERADAERRRKEHDAKQRRAIVVTSLLAVAAAVTVVVLGLALTDARRQRNSATRNWNLAFAQLLAAKAQLAFSDPAVPRQTAALLAATSVKFSDDHKQPSSIESRTVLATAISWMPRTLPPIPSPTDQPIFAIARAARAPLLAVATRDGSVAIAGPEGTVLHRLPRAPDPIGDIWLSGDGRYLVRTGTTPDRAVEIWDVERETRLAQLACPDAPNGAAVLAPDNSLLLAPCGRFYMWDAEAWRAGRTWTVVPWMVPFGQVATIAFDATGQRVAVAGEGEAFSPRGLVDSALIYDIRQRRQVRRFALRYPARVRDVAFLGGPDDRVAILEDSTLVRLWPMRADQPSATLPHDKPVVDVQASPPDGQTLLTLTSDGIVRLWDGQGHQQAQMSLGQGVLIATFDWATRQLAALTGDRLSRWVLWDLDQRRPLPAASVFSPFRVVAADRIFAATEPEKAIEVLDFDGNHHRLPFQSPPAAVAVAEDGAMAAAIVGGDRDVPELVLLREDPVLRLFGIVVRLRLPVPYRGARVAVRFSADGRLVMTMRSSLGEQHPAATIDVFDLAGRLQATYQLPADAIDLVQFTADRHLLVYTATGELTDLDPASGATRVMAGRSSRALVSGRGTLIAVAEPRRDTDRRLAGAVVRLLTWPALQKQREWPIEGSFTQLAFSADDGALASGGSDGTIHVWDTRTGEEQARILFGEPVSALAFGSGGKTVIAVGRGQATRYAWKLPDLINQVCYRTVGKLAQLEWEAYIPEAFRSTAEPYRCLCTLACK